jgi:NADPH-dependent glutamate synthase beta subunit-like oxidoreductase
MIYRVSSAHEELDNRIFSVSTQEFIGDGNGNLEGLKIVETKFENGKFEPIPGTEKELPADFVFLAMGFTGPEKSALLEQLEVELDRTQATSSEMKSSKVHKKEFSWQAMQDVVNLSLSGQLPKVVQRQRRWYRPLSGRNSASCPNRTYNSPTYGLTFLRNYFTQIR